MRSELNQIETDIENDKKLLKMEKRGFHYKDCIWFDPACKCGPDTCH